MSTIYTAPSAIAIMAAALDAAPAIQKAWAENAQRSQLVKSALTAMEQGNISDCASILGDLVEKASAAVPALPEPKLPALAISKSHPDQRDEVAAARLIEKRNRLVQLRDSLSKAAPVPAAITLPSNVTAVTAAQRLSKADLDRKAALAHRLELIRGQLDSRRNWQPLKVRKAALTMQLNQLRQECTT
jgi:hypothetical protein